MTQYGPHLIIDISIVTDLQLLRGPDVQPATGSGRDYIYRTSTTDWKMISGGQDGALQKQSRELPTFGLTKGGASTPTGGQGHGGIGNGWRDVSVPGGKGSPSGRLVT